MGAEAELGGDGDRLWTSFITAEGDDVFAEKRASGS